ncbi:restriction endonuclease subunit S [Streptococcus sanguinis]|uniref:restriction endonuclease subunit S n=1 Tax=Streptococcus sanguinis TaxID=1305 RepID=UPI001CC058A4|nr:restriction endonuclease subunit S [Streptococcus sanguinis]MBZ2025848.1 restriction endonuclease subunit S [Streptococcus sanguinis]
MKKQSNVPQIRFLNFEELWKDDKLNNIFGTIRNAFVGTATPYYVEEGNFYLESNNVKNGKINFNSQIFINDEFYEKQRDKWLKTNDIVMVQSGHVGHTAVIPEELNNTAAHALIVFTDYMEEVDPHFLNYQFQSNGKRKELDLISTGNTIKHILASEMKNFKMDFPTVDEQSAIGSLFRTLDDLLTSYKDNLANYQSLKATMLYKMFPKAGQIVPEIRLDGFEGEWEKGTIGEFGSFYYGKSAPKWSVTEDATIPCVRYGELYTKFSTKIDKIYSYTSILKENLKLSSGNEILVPRVGENPLDFANCSWLSLKDVAIGEMISVYNTHNNPLFIAYYFNAKMKKEFAKRVEGGSVANLYYTYLENISISVPSIPEQQAIGAYFSNLDNIINSHQEKISQLETLKKKLLQDMFI